MSNLFQDLLLEKYLDWQKQVGEKRNVKQFADHIGMSDKYLNLLWNAKRNPSEKVIEHLVEFFDEPRFYDVIGKKRPDPELVKLIRAWPTISEEGKKKISEQAAQYKTEK